jgi:4-hydroxy-2-oxoheptanedioate aldolase
MPYLMMSAADYVRSANEQTFVVVQIEDAETAARAGEIAAVPGVDVLFLGPGDFSILGGFPGQMDHPAIATAMQQVSEAARRAGKHWGMPCFSVEHGRRLLDMGARFLAHGADILLVKRGLEQIQQQFAPLGFQFPRKGSS